MMRVRLFSKPFLTDRKRLPEILKTHPFRLKSQLECTTRMRRQRHCASTDDLPPHAVAGMKGQSTINGLILEYLLDISEAGTSLKIEDHPSEIIQAQGRQGRVAREVQTFPELPQKT